MPEYNKNREIETRRVLAFDFGASSGRAILGSYVQDHILLEEIHRFSNDPVTRAGTLYWDLPKLYAEIEKALEMAEGSYESIGIDTWGLDFGLLDKAGKLLEDPVHYRDARTEGMAEEVFQIISKEELYARAGTQTLSFNTIFQLYYLATRRPELLEQTHKILFMPDLFVYMLTGAQNTEYTMASTTGLMDAGSHQWCFDIMEKLGIPRHIFCDIVMPGTVAGTYKGKSVIYVGGHDTASAELAVPAQSEEFVFISSGTWSLMGTELPAPELKRAYAFNFTNEGCFDGKIRLLKNIMGLWLIQECRRQWKREGLEVSFAQLEQEAMAAKAGEYDIDVDDDLFLPPGDMPGRVRDYCIRTGQKAPETRGQIIRCIYENLTQRYRQVLDSIQEITGKQYDCIHVVGGGTKDRLLSQFTADACGVPVMAGPVEATAIGNIAGQLIALGDLKNVKEARALIAKSFPLETFYPQKSGE